MQELRDWTVIARYVDGIVTRGKKFVSFCKERKPGFSFRVFLTSSNQKYCSAAKIRDAIRFAAVRFGTIPR